VTGSDALETTSDATGVLPRTADRSIFLAAKGGGIVFAGTLIAYGSRLLMGIVLGRYLGAEQFGLYSLALTAAELAAGLALLGLGPALVRYVSLFASRGDTARLWGTLQVGLGLTTIAGLVIGVGLFALAGPIAEGLFHEPRLIPLMVLAAAIVPVLALNTNVAAATRGFGKMQYTTITQLIARPQIRLILLVVVAVTVGLNAARALGVFLATVCVALALILYFLNRLFPLRRPARTARRDTKEMLVFSLPVYLSDLIGTFRGSIQTVLLGAFNSVTTVGIFAAATRVNVIGEAFHGAISTSSMPIISELYDRGERKQLARFYQTMTKWTLTLNLPLFLIVLLFSGSILSVFGEDFVGGAVALTVLAWGNLANAATGICGAVLDMTGKTPLKLFNSIILTALTLGLNFLLIPRWGLMGAATAALVARVTVNLLRLAEVFFLYRMLPYNVG
jgi:O-antigen/teichoic acid export membrane protein